MMVGSGDRWWLWIAGEGAPRTEMRTRVCVAHAQCNETFHFFIIVDAWIDRKREGRARNDKGRGRLLFLSSRCDEPPRRRASKKPFPRGAWERGMAARVQGRMHMILEYLTLRNFCLFRGTQALDLRPAERRGKKLPIVLFGGINGGGKTTLFDAIQLALYGSRARCSKRASLSYDDFLIQSIHHGIPPEEGAGVALSFRSISDGLEHDYEVRRDWRVEEGKLRESVVILLDGLANYSLTRSWPQLVEELIPLEIAQLFFFDGEKIRSLAEDASSSETLGSAIKSLLGLDIVERLIADSSILQARLGRNAAESEQREQAEALDKRLQAVDAELKRLALERASLENHRLRAEEEERQAEGAFAASGGKHREDHEQRVGRLAELKALAEETEARLMTLAGGELPLALVTELLGRVGEQDRREEEAGEAEIVGRLLRERDEELLAVLRRKRADDGVVKLIDEYLERDRQARAPAEPVSRRLALSSAGRSLLGHLQGQRLAELKSEAGFLLEKLAVLTGEREDLERALQAVPGEDDLARLVERLKKATQTLTQLNDQGKQLDDASEGLKKEHLQCERQLEGLWQAEFKREDQKRMIELVGRTRGTMQQFLHRATASKIDRLSSLISECFRFLLRKQTLGERILIDPATFAVTLFDVAGQAIRRQRLSEGEKQLFAVSMLWGLARASARPLPAVIDTPMARLDATHRQHLVERYFPNASHQVVILSTDTEVDRHYYPLLRPSLARAYHLRYDEASRQTVGEEGYFWREDDPPRGLEESA